MYRLIEVIQNKAGDALEGYRVRLLTAAGAIVPIYADTSSTPIISVSGVADTMVTNDRGEVSCYVDNGDYTLEVLDSVGGSLYSIEAVPMYASNAYDTGVATAAAASATADALTASTAATTATTQAGIAAAAASSAVNAPGTSATSSTSLTVGTGSKSLTIETGKLYAIGQFVIVANTATPANYMLGQVTAINTGTGALTVNVTSIGGSGTFTAWTVSVSGRNGTDGAGSGTVTSVGGTGTVSGLTLTGTVTSTGNLTLGGTLDVAMANIQADAVTNAKLANVATATIKGRVTAATGDVEDLTGTQATTLLDAFTSSLKGLAPASGGGTANFLRADGTWAAAGGGATYGKAPANQTTTSATAVDITNLAFTPAADTTYDFEAVIIAKLSSGTSNFKIGLAWPTGLTTGHALLSHTTSLTLNHTSFATNDQSLVEVTNAATYLSPAFSLGADTYRMIRVVGIVDAGATPSGAFKLQFASNGSHTATIKAGSFIKYKAVA